ncbi:MAG: beta-propeller fold lactonase family protein [Solirubrobacteraceae bacterium]
MPGGPFRTEPGGWPVAVAYSPDGKYLAAADSAGDNVVLFAVGGGGALRRMALLRTGKGGAAGISGPDDVAFSPNGRLLAAANFEAGTVAMFAER